MTIITNKFTVGLVLLILCGAFFYISFNLITEEPHVVTDAELKENEEISIEIMEEEVSNELIKNDEIEYFISSKLERDRIRSRNLELWQKIVEDPNSTAESRKEAQQKILNLTDTFEKELQIEKMIIAKGFKDAVVFIKENQVTAVINEKELSEKDAVVILDIISSITGQNRENIKISPIS